MFIIYLGCNLLALPMHGYLQTNPASILDFMCAAVLGGAYSSPPTLFTNGDNRVMFAYVYTDMCECERECVGREREQMSVLVSCKHS